MPLYAPFNGGTITTPILAGNGTSSLPSYTFSADPTQGFYRPGANSFALKTQQEYRWGADFELGGGLAISWYTGGAFAAVNVALQPAGASTARLEVNNGTLTTYRDLIARQLFAGGDSTAGIASSTSLTNATDTTVTNTYLVRGGQAANTVNTGWIKIYVGTSVAWIPHWTNATP